MKLRAKSATHLHVSHPNGSSFDDRNSDAKIAQLRECDSLGFLVTLEKAIPMLGHFSATVLTCSNVRLALGRPAALFLLLLTGWSAIGTTAGAQQTIQVVMKNGLQIGPGAMNETTSISELAIQRGTGEAPTAPIIIIDDELRKTYVNRQRIDMGSTGPSTAPPPEVIDLPSRNDVSKGVGEYSFVPSGTTDFNKHGRRYYFINDSKLGRIPLLQAITRITPLYCQLQMLRSSGTSPDIFWDMRIGTSTIPPAKLREILHHELDLTKGSEYLRLVRFYIQTGRFLEARNELAEGIQKFPELAEYKNLLEQQTQEIANQMFREIELVRRSGQHQFASKLLQSFPLTELPLETQLKVQDQAENLKNNLLQISSLTKSLQEDLAKLPAADTPIVAPVIEQIIKEVNLDSSARLTDYARLRTDASLSVEQRISLAVGGWLAGPGSGLDNLAVTRSLARVSGLVTEYLSSANESRRAEILKSLTSEEAGQPEMIGKLLAFMKPPVALPAAPEGAPAGYYRLSVPADELNPQPTEYAIQLPPEYDPLRRYPCVVALPALGMSPDLPISWWAGGFDAKRNARLGLASRYGYIVISPSWALPDQMRYNYSEGEHSRILRCLRDAMRRTSIDTDRIFISGHQDGGTAAWDLSLAHPDLWAGLVSISPSPEKYIVEYNAKNGQYVPSYIVWGSKVSMVNLENIQKVVNASLKSPKYDCIAVQYEGRPQDHFLEELPRIIDWMELSNHRRDRMPRELAFDTARPGDRYFYWLEIADIDSSSMINPLQFQPGKGLAIEANINPDKNTLRVSKYPGKKVWVWVRPGMFDTTLPFEITTKGNKKERIAPAFSTETLLEDVRQRADRLAPYYQRIEVR